MSVPPPSTAPAAREFEWWAPFVALLFAYGATIVLITIVAGVTGNDAGKDLPAGITLAATFVQDGLLVVATVAFTKVIGIVPTPATFGLRRVNLRRVLPAAALAFVVFYVFLLAWSRLQPSAKDDLLHDLGAKSSTLAAIAVAALVCVVAPLVEELFFRGFLFPSLQRGMGWLPAALLSGAIFGGVHAGGTPAIFLVPLAVLGFLLCALFRRTGSLLPGMAVHSFNNSLSIAVGLSLSVPGAIAVMLGAPLVVLAIATAVAE